MVAQYPCASAVRRRGRQAGVRPLHEVKSRCRRDGRDWSNQETNESSMHATPTMVIRSRRGPQAAIRSRRAAADGTVLVTFISTQVSFKVPFSAILSWRQRQCFLCRQSTMAVSVSADTARGASVSAVACVLIGGNYCGVSGIRSSVDSCRRCASTVVDAESVEGRRRSMARLPGSRRRVQYSTVHLSQLTGSQKR